MAWWVPLAIIAASALAKNKANTDALKRQENIRGAMERFQRTKAAETEAATEQLIQKQTPQARQDELAQLEADRSRSMSETVASATPAPATIAGNLSPEYQKSQESAANSVAARTKRAIEQLSAMGAPGEQQQKFGLRHGRAAGVVDASNIASARVGDRYMEDIDNVRPDGFLSLAGDIGMAYGAGMLGGGAGTAAAAGAAGGTGITPGTAGEGLQMGGGLGLRPNGLRLGSSDMLGIKPKLERGFSIWKAG